MDAATATALVDIAEDVRARLRRQEPDAARQVEERYPEMLEALDWCIDHGHTDVAYRLASALVQYWISTKRIGDGDNWFGRVLASPMGSDGSRGRALYDHGYLVFWAGHYRLAADRFMESRAIAAALFRLHAGGARPRWPGARGTQQRRRRGSPAAPRGAHDHGRKR